MSKYYKAEDAIRAIEEMENCYNGWSDTYDKAQIIGVLEELPTIEVSEEQLSKLKSRENSVENTTVSEDFTSISRAKSKLEVSEDCISREFALKVIDNYGYNYPTNGDKACAIKNAPSVVPSRAEGEWYRQTTDHFDYWECSECGIGVGLDDIKNYCPNCGAKMRDDNVEDD